MKKRTFASWTGDYTSTTSLSTVLKTACLLCIFCLASCAKDVPEIDPEKQDQSYVLKFKHTEAIELKQVQADNKTQDIPLEDINKYFGKRAELNAPKELRFSKDSLSIVKGDDSIENYKIKWQNSLLSYYNDQSDSWLYCGEKENDSFNLNTGFYIQTVKSDQRTLTLLGQAYALQSLTDLTEQGEQTTTTWLKMKYTFE